MSYLPIENYGLIGNMYTAALVGMNGSIDWLCFPHFDSPSLFCSILDDNKGGRFQICPFQHEEYRQKQFYWPDTNVLVTRFLSSQGVGQVIDFMPIGGQDPQGGSYALVRKVETIKGSMHFQMECAPAFNYARDAHDVRVQSDGAVFRSQDLSMMMMSTHTVIKKGQGVVADFTLEEGQTAVFVMREAQGDEQVCKVCSVREGIDLFQETVDFWRAWLSKCTYVGRWREMVYRSALTLKMLTFEPTGAIVAAPTCSLPEGIGGERNWDYRFTWIRDAAFTIYGLLRIGFTEEAEKFMGWVEARCHELNADGSLQIMYGIDGRHELPEKTLDHLEGYMGSSPVRIGNAASSQLQLDIYGELLDSVYLYNKYGAPISYDLWVHLSKLINWVCDNWTRTDEGVWEIRGGQQHFVYSKLMCWVAVDRGIRLADKRSFPADRVRWLKVRDEIFREIMAKGWNPQREAFVQYFGGATLDAANLMMPLVFFLSPADPRMLKTLDKTMKPPEQGGLVSNSLVYRYNVGQTFDGLKGEEGTFNICTFWLVEALTRAGRHDRARLNKARLMFEQMLGYANHLGLYSEETGPRGEALGNTPQAFTHLAMISAAFNLDRALGGRR
jgi:GH15 family glucan-1,4-alpha-glucosidase